jgi:hypothetical protein
MRVGGGSPDVQRRCTSRTAWTLGRWVAASTLDQAEVEDALYAAAEQNGLVSDTKDGPRRTQPTFAAGLSLGTAAPAPAGQNEVFLAVDPTVRGKGGRGHISRGCYCRRQWRPCSAPELSCWSSARPTAAYEA